ncbi:MAG: hypothetical protein ACYDBH_19650 [Acidobacteriaceae bacterium]
MKSNQLISEIQGDRVPLVAGQKDARAWLGFQACRGLALNTLDAYGRRLEVPAIGVDEGDAEDT